MDRRESEFAVALLEADRTPPRGIVVPSGASVAQRFAVYRNNVVAGLVNALQSRFPVVAELVGEAFFKAMAQNFLVASPPRSPLLFLYGEAFPAFIEGFAPAADLPYLPDVARLEMARGRAYHAADAKPLAADAYASLTPDALETTTLILHPSVELLVSRFPILSIWQAHQGRDRPSIAMWDAEAALIVRPELDVMEHRLPDGGFAFISALAGGASFTQAAAVAAKAAEQFDLVQNLALLIEARAGIGLRAVRS
jgi:hypothetical protein